MIGAIITQAVLGWLLFVTRDRVERRFWYGLLAIFLVLLGVLIYDVLQGNL